MVAEMQNTVFADDHDAYHDICDEPSNRCPEESEQDARDTAGDRKYHEMMEGMD
jgi:hypothetical protein